MLQEIEENCKGSDNGGGNVELWSVTPGGLRCSTPKKKKEWLSGGNKNYQERYAVQKLR